MQWNGKLSFAIEYLSHEDPLQIPFIFRYFFIYVGLQPNNTDNYTIGKNSKINNNV